MKISFKILPIIAIVVGIGGAWANQAQDSPCQTDGTPGYEKVDAGLPNPTDAPINEPNMQSVGTLGTNFECNRQQPQTCFWTYAPGHPEAVDNWIECIGERQPKSN